MSKIWLSGIFLLMVVFTYILIYRLAPEWEKEEELLDAAEMRNFDQVKELLPQISNLNAIAGYDEWTALTAASRNGDLKMVEWLLGHGADPNAVEGGGNSAIFWASLNGHDAVVRLLISKGGDPWQKCADCISPREMALSKNHLSIVKLIDETVRK